MSQLQNIAWEYPMGEISSPMASIYRMGSTGTRTRRGGK